MISSGSVWPEAVPGPDLVTSLRGVVGDDACLVRPEDLFVYEADGLTLHRARPRAVVLPREKAQVAGVVKACRAFGVPFVPRGAGTGLSGGALALDGGVVIECARMNQILEVNLEDRYAVLQPGVINLEVSKAVAPHGLFYAPDPSSQAACTIGGNVAENSGGIHTLKYGTTTDHVLALEVVLPDGEFASFGSRTGWTQGYDLVGAFVGSEGTLGVVTEATVRLLELPQSVETVLAVFADVFSACRSVGAIISAGLVPAALEVIDQRTIAAVEASAFAAGLPTDAGAILLIELDGPSATVARELERVCGLLSRADASRVEVARDEQERQQFWRARKGAFGAMGRLAPDLYLYDTVVPRVKLPEVLEQICEIGDRYRLRLSNVFHAGDGNLHPIISFDRRDADEMKRVLAAGEEILRVCVDAGGVLSGEHGIGNEKNKYMGLLFGEDDLDAMRRLRAAFDPRGLCNPGKVLPTPRACVEAGLVARDG
jgi:glycolate oxidase subunit GlcD